MYLLAVCHISQLHVILLPVQKVITTGQEPLFRQNSQGGMQGQAHHVLRNLVVRTRKASRGTSIAQRLEVLGNN